MCWSERDFQSFGFGDAERHGPVWALLSAILGDLHRDAISNQLSVTTWSSTPGPFSKVLYTIKVDCVKI